MLVTREVTARDRSTATTECIAQKAADRTLRKAEKQVQSGMNFYHEGKQGLPVDTLQHLCYSGEHAALLHDV